VVSDHRDNAFDIRKHIGVPEPDYAIAFAFDETRAFLVLYGSVGMLPTVGFNNQPCPVRTKIGIIDPERHLKPEFRLGKGFSQGAADVLLGFRRIASQLARSIRGRSRQPLALGQAVRIPPHPPTRLRGAGCSLSHKGRGKIRATYLRHLTGTPGIRRNPCSRPARTSARRSCCRLPPRPRSRRAAPISSAGNTAT